MSRTHDADTRYFIEIELQTLTVTRCGYDQKQNLDKGRQSDPAIHRLFLTKGQYGKLVSRCGAELATILDS